MIEPVETFGNLSISFDADSSNFYYFDSFAAFPLFLRETFLLLLMDDDVVEEVAPEVNYFYYKISYFIISF